MLMRDSLIGQPISAQIAPPPPDLAAALRAALRPRTLQKHLVLVLALMAAVFGLGGFYLATRTVFYEATSSVLIRGSALSTEARRLATSSQSDLRGLSLQILQLTAEKARLEAEASGATTLSFPKELLESPEADALAPILNGEKLLFAARIKAASDASEILRKMLQLTREESTSFTKQVEFSTVQQKLIEEELASVRMLAEKGLAPATRQRDLERAVAIQASRGVELDSQLLARRQRITETEQKLADIEADRRTEALTRLQAVNAEMRSTQVRIQQATTLVALANSAGAVDPASVENQAEIIRSDRMAADVIRQKSLDKDDRFLSSGRTPPAEVMQSPELRMELADYLLRQGLRVERVGRGSRLDIGYTSSDPGVALKVSNAYASTYLGENLPDAGEQAVPSQVLRTAVVRMSSPPAFNVMIAMLFIGLVVAPGAAFALETLRVLAPKNTGRSDAGYAA